MSKPQRTLLAGELHASIDEMYTQVGERLFCVASPGTQSDLDSQ